MEALEFLKILIILIISISLILFVYFNKMRIRRIKSFIAQLQESSTVSDKVIKALKDRFSDTLNYIEPIPSKQNYPELYALDGFPEFSLKYKKIMNLYGFSLIAGILLLLALLFIEDFILV